MKNKSIFRIPILDVYYERKDNVTKCTVRWYNPINNNTQVSTGIARCNPMDEPNDTIGMRIAEGRAKMNMFRTYRLCANKAIGNINTKFWNLFLHEAKHLQEIIDKL